MGSMREHVGHDVAIRVDETNVITLECDTCGEYITAEGDEE
jgi:hypothetical protein